MTDHKPIAKITLAYVKGISEAISRVLKKVDIGVSFYPPHTFRQLLVKPKDVVPLESRSGVVHKVPCKNCERTYVGQTKRSLVVRIKEHRRAASFCWRQ